MDATNPLRRWLDSAACFALATGLATGCAGNKPILKPTDTGFSPRSPAKQAVPAEVETVRGQSPTSTPTEVIPGFPVAPLPPTKPDLPTASSTPTPTPPAPQATQASYSPSDPKPMREFILNDKPRVKVVAIVGKGNIITDEEVWQALRQRKDYHAALIASDREQREQEMYRFELKRLIERELLIDDMFAKMKKAKNTASDEIKDFASKIADRQMREARKANGFATETDFQDKALTPQGLSLPVLRRQIERGTMSNEYIRSLVKEKVKGIGLGDVHEYYVKHPDLFQNPDRVKWLDIFIAYAKFPTPEEARKHAELIRIQAVSGGDFSALVKQFDHGDASLRNGYGAGELRGEIRPEEIEPVLFEMKPGEVSKPIPVAAGYHIVKVIERQNAGTLPFDEKTQTAIRGMITEQMQRAEYNRLVENLWRNGAVQIVDVP